MFKPVKVRTLDSDRPRRLTSLPEATEFILLSWPAHQSPTLENARQQCLDAISGKVPVEVARAAFIAAAKESGIYVRRSRLKKLVAIVAGTDDTKTEPT
jgi:hypothetical protein